MLSYYLKMFSCRAMIIAVCLAFIAAMSAFSASAQNCDDQDVSCQRAGPPLFPLFPFFPLFPPGIEPSPAPPEQAAPPPLDQTDEPNVTPMAIDPGVSSQYASLYAPVRGERFPVSAVDLSNIDPQFLRKVVQYPTREQPGTIVIDPQNHFLYLVQGGGWALRYGVGVGREGFGWSGVATIHNKQEWPDWYPPKEMIQRQPELMQHLRELQGGTGMPGGALNPLGSRAMYLWEGNKDTLYRIHGTVEPWTIGQSHSSGCIRMINQDVIDLYQRVPVGTRVVVLSQQ